MPAPGVTSSKAYHELLGLAEVLNSDDAVCDAEQDADWITTEGSHATGE